MKRIFALGAAIALLGTFAVAAEEEPVGREVAAYGTLAEAEGTLNFMHDEWFLTNPDGEFELHMGPFGHTDEPVFAENTNAWIRGFFLGDHIAPVEVRTENATHDFWTVERFPIWAGSGEGGGRVAHTNPEIPIGRREETGEFGLGGRLGDPDERRFDPPEDRRFEPPVERRFSPPADAEPRFRNAPPYQGRNR
ncbi:MAG: hypothetical protein EA426_14685 [Spirochaetaceae bacterium]|nr:MAG: hypothetical protein EA426_14685 [Spirochaetaceae bacterium]